MKNINRKSKGIFFILLSSLFYGSYGIWSKLIGNEFGSFFQAWTRGLIILLILVPIGIYLKSYKRIQRKDIKWFLVVSLPGSAVFAPYFYAFTHIEIGTATLLFYAALIITGYISGKIFFKEQLTLKKILSLIFAFIGMSLIFSIYFNSSVLLGAICTIGAGICGGIEVVFTKKLSTEYSGIQITTSLFFTILITNFVLSLFFGEKFIYFSLSSAWIAQVAFSLSALSAFTCVILGYKYLEPSIASILGLTEIIFGVVFGIILFKESFALINFIGGLFIIIAAVIPNIGNNKQNSD